jgi:hypothetical protein
MRKGDLIRALSPISDQSARTALVEVHLAQIVQRTDNQNKGSKFTSSQNKLLITNNAFIIVQRATAQPKTRIFRDYGVAEAPPGFQAGWSDFFFFSFCSFRLLIWVFRVSFCTHEGLLPYRSAGVSFVVLGVLEPQTAHHWFRSAAISRNLTNSVGRSLL